MCKQVSLMFLEDNNQRTREYLPNGLLQFIKITNALQSDVIRNNRNKIVSIKIKFNLLGKKIVSNKIEFILLSNKIVSNLFF